MHLGLIHTHARLADLRAALTAMRANYVKVVPAWWPHPPQALAALPQRKAIRTSWGDPSYANGARAYPLIGPTLDELRPYLDAMPDAAVELGNEPSGHGIDVGRYAADLAETVSALRRAYPRATILPPAHSPHAADRVAWLTTLAPIARQCDAATIHGYSDAEVRSELSLIRRHVSGSLPVWLTEVNYGMAMPDVHRARALAALLRDLPGVPVALLYHLDTHDSAPLEQQGGAHYRLSLATLQALGQEPEPMPDPEFRHWPALRVAGFTMDVRQWRTVGAFRRHLAAHQPAAQVAPWARGLTIHHTYRPLPSQWAGAAGCVALARYYRNELKWSVGPHLFVTGTAAKAEDLGIWQLSPLNVRGIHAASFNATHWGVEMLGDYNVSHPPADTLALACGAAAALLDWRGLPTSAVNGHRDDPKTDKNCPGRNVDLPTLRRGIDALRGL